MYIKKVINIRLREIMNFSYRNTQFTAFGTILFCYRNAAHLLFTRAWQIILHQSPAKQFNAWLGKKFKLSPQFQLKISNVQAICSYKLITLSVFSALVCVRAHPKTHRKHFLGSAVCSRLPAQHPGNRRWRKKWSCFCCVRERGWCCMLARSRLHLHTCTCGWSDLMEISSLRERQNRIFRAHGCRCSAKNI